MTESQDTACREHLEWALAEQKRVSHEWDRWDGTSEHADKINDSQCARAIAARQRIASRNGVELSEATYLRLVV